MSKQTKTVIVTILATLGVLFLLIVLTEDDTSTPKPEISAPENVQINLAVDKSDSIGDVFEDAFMRGCEEENGTPAYCKCTYDYLDDNYTNDEFMQELRDFNDYDKDLTLMDSAVDACIQYYE